MLRPVITVALVAAGISLSPSLRKGGCGDGHVLVVHADGREQKIPFPATGKTRCSDFGISPDKRYAGWMLTGELSTESDDGTRRVYPDASLYILVNGSAAELANARYIEDWRFVETPTAVLSRTAFEHGPTTYVLQDAATQSEIERCEAHELEACPRIRKLLAPK